MNIFVGGAVVLWLAANSAPEIQPGGKLPKGLLPASAILEACEVIDGLESEIASPDISSEPIRLAAPVTISKGNLGTLLIALKLAGIYRIDFTDKRGKRFAYVTRDPRVPPPQKRNFEVEVFRIQHIDIDTALSFLKQKVVDLESNVPESQRTIVAGYAKTRRLVVRYTSAERLETYRKLIAKIDVDPDVPTLVLRRYTPRHRRNDDLLADFQERWKKAGKDPVNVVAARSAHVLLFRLEEQTWAEIQELLKELDQPQ